MQFCDNKKVKVSKDKQNRFVLNDESVINSYGFRVLTDGIDLSRFEKNPVMLKNHYNHPDYVIGKWADIQKSEGKLTATAEFDTDDEDSAKIAGKVDRGFLNASSMGIGFIIREMQTIDGESVVTKCELYEASIVAVPSNASAVRLYNDKGEQIKEEEVKNFMLSFQTHPEQTQPENKNKDMKQLVTMAALVALSLQENLSEDKDAISQAILSLKKDRDQLAQKVSDFEQKETAAKEAAILSMVDAAVKDGRISAQQKDGYVKLAQSDMDLAKTTLDGLPKKKDFAAGVQGAPSDGGVATMDDFQKLSLAQQLAFKTEQPEAYQKIVESINKQ